MRSKILLGLLSLILLAGCIEFERQTVTYAYDSRSDTLRIFQDYHGIFGGDSTNSLSAEELRQLESVLNSQRTFFFGNWITEISHNQLQEFLEQKTESTKDDKDEPREIHTRTLVKLLLDNVKIENGGFYMDANGKLSGVQRVTVTRVSELIAAGNVAIRDAIKAQALQPETTAEEKSIYLQSSDRPQAYIKLDGNRITARLPATKQQYDQWLSPSCGQKQAVEFKKCGGQLGFTNNELVVSIGQPADKQTSVTLSFSEKAYVTNVLQVVKKRSLLQDKFDSHAALRDFISAKK